MSEFEGLFNDDLVTVAFLQLSAVFVMIYVYALLIWFIFSMSSIRQDDRNRGGPPLIQRHAK
jgi:hypothetical protein